MTVGQPDSTLTTLPITECMSLLHSRGVGRLGVTADGYPMIIPVNYLMDGDSVVIRSRIGKTVGSADHANVTFQVDNIDEIARTGWTVVVRGRAVVITGRDHDPTAERTRRLDLRPYVPGHDVVWIRIEQHGVAGRRITRADDGRWRLDAAYP